MWHEAYLETCCRSALHRLALAGRIGRPATEKDRQCLERLRSSGFAQIRSDGRFGITSAGMQRHIWEIGPVPTSDKR